MKRLRLIRLLLSLLVIFVSISGCTSAPPPAANKTSAMAGGGITKSLVQTLAKLAVKYGDDALQAQQRANLARNLNKLDDLLVHQQNAAKFAKLAQEKADEAVALQQKLDDLARLQVADDVLRAQKAAADAEVIAASMTNLRLFAYRQKVQDSSARIIASIPSDLKEVAKEVVPGLFCYVLAQRLAGPMPKKELVQFSVRIRLIGEVQDPAYFSTLVTDSMLVEADYLANSLKWQDDVDGYKDACEAIADLP
jgi:hypothetical protein